MIKINERLHGSAEEAHATLTLSFEQRQKSRLQVTLDNGEEAGLSLPRGTVLRSGDQLRAEDGRVIEVCAAAEPVTTASTGDTHLLTRAAYHLGNRHVALQIGEGWIRYLADHVLDAMVGGLGLGIVHEERPFEPEVGAYPGSSHDHREPHDGPHPP